MAFEEKLTWISATVTVVVAGVYFAVVGSRMGGTPVAEVAYQVPMLIAMGAMIVLTIAGVIATSIGTAIGAAVVAEAGARGSGETAANEAVKDIDRKDERDELISARGGRVGYNVLSLLMVGVLALAMLRYDQFWIANAMFVAFVITGLTDATVKIVAYRRGF
jgi:hypothetical protein